MHGISHKSMEQDTKKRIKRSIFDSTDTWRNENGDLIMIYSTDKNYYEAVYMNEFLDGFTIYD